MIYNWSINILAPTTKNWTDTHALTLIVEAVMLYTVVGIFGRFIIFFHRAMLVCMYSERFTTLC